MYAETGCGCSQARFQRLRKGAIHAFLSEVAEILEKISDARIILAGPGTTKIQFRDMLPHYIVERIVDIIDIGIDDEWTELIVDYYRKTLFSTETYKHLMGLFHGEISLPRLQAELE